MTKKLNSPFFASRIKSDEVKAKEKWLGYLLGPSGAAQNRFRKNSPRKRFRYGVRFFETLHSQLYSYFDYIE